MIGLIETFLLNRLPPEQRRTARVWLHRHMHPAWLGNIRRTVPLSQRYGYDRGQPVDRYYIEAFLGQHSGDIHGRVLEVKDRSYTTRFGQGVTHSDVVDIDPANSVATVTADLSAADSIPAERYDCFVITQTLQFIYDFHSVIRHTYRILRPGGVLLATAAGTSRIAPGWGLEGEFWRFTSASCRRMFGEVFGESNIRVQAYGNVLSSIAFLLGMASEELTQLELGRHDPYFPLIVCVRAVRPKGS